MIYFLYFYNFHSQDSWGDKIKDMQIWAMFIFFIKDFNVYEDHT